MAFDDEEQTAIEEEQRHARRGACAALLIFPPFVCCVLWVVLTFTPNGQSLVARTYLFVSYDGFAIHDLTSGFRGVARASCALDQTNPKPENYELLQENYEIYYRTLVELYSDSWQELKARGEDVERYEDPARIPPNLSRGKSFYCR